MYAKDVLEVFALIAVWKNKRFLNNQVKFASIVFVKYAVDNQRLFPNTNNLINYSLEKIRLLVKNG